MNINISPNLENGNGNGNQEKNKSETLEFSESSEFKKYIIKNNIQLTNENKELRERIAELEKEKNELETENDKYDERIRYMRGLLHNLYSLKEMSIEVKDNWEKYSKNYNKLFNKYIKIEKLIGNIFQLYIMNLLLILFIDQILFGTFILFFKVIFYNVISIVIMFKSKKYIFNEQLFHFKLSKKNLFTIEFNNDFTNIHFGQLELAKETNMKMIDIKELEKSCVGVSVMIDNV